jgi:hypothetical protein
MTARRILRIGVLGVVLLLAASASARGEDAKPGLSTGGSIREALGKLGEGRDVELVLNNGKSYRGKLGSVGASTVLVTQLTGKEFYDVLIALDQVAAVELRVRGSN